MPAGTGVLTVQLDPLFTHKVFVLSCLLVLVKLFAALSITVFYLNSSLLGA